MISEPCPDLEDLRRLIGERLAPAREAEIEAHIEGCRPCQDRLEELTARWAWDRALRETQPDDASDGRSPGASMTVELGTTADLDRVAPAPSSGSETGHWGVGETTAKLVAVDHPGGSEATEDGPSGPDAAQTALVVADVRDASPQGPQADGRTRWPSIPGYELRKKLGEGGMGVVYLARQTGLDRMVAVKMIRGGKQAYPEHLARFRTEAEAVARLRHPHILQIFDIGEADGLPYFSLELLEGGSLDDRLAGTPQPGRSAAALMITLGRAVQVAHEAGIIHRDLKPSNVLFTADGIPKIADFGLAKRIQSDSRQTESGMIMGSPSYMAPEQASGHTRDVGPAADVYALGAILYEMLTGRPPFKGETAIETVRQVIESEVVPPSRLVHRVARDLETICLKCLGKEPEKRYASAKALVEDLERFLNGEAILARPTPTLERAWKWARRRPLRAAAMAAAILAVLGLPAYAVYREHRMDRHAIELMRQGDRLVDEARGAQSQSDLSSVGVKLSQYRDRLSGEDPRRVEGLPERIRIALADVESRLKEAKDGEAKQKRDRIDRGRYEEFQGLGYRAQIVAAEFELDAAGRQSRLRDSARRALAVYARDPGMSEEDWAPVDPLPDALSAAEKARVIEGCYDLLLLISRATEAPAGLKVLDRAGRLRPATAAYHLRRADCLARAGDRAGQAREEKLAAGTPLATASDHFLIGRERMAQRRWIEAIEALDASMRLDPGHLAARLLLAICDYNAEPKRLGEARDHLNACLAGRPDLVELYLLRARVQGEEGNQALARIGVARPAERASLRRQAESAFRAALADYREALGRIPSDDYRYVLLVNRGGMLLQAGRLEESRADLEAAVALRPRSYQAYATLGQLHRRRGRLDDAAAALGAAIERVEDPSVRVALLRTRALLHARRRDATPADRVAALRDLDEVLRLEPAGATERVEDLVDRARLLFDASRYPEALDGCRAALREAPDHPGALRLRISVLMASRRYDDVLEACDGYLDRGDPTVEVLEIRGLARVARQRFSGAIADYTRALELRRDLDATTRSRLLNRRGWAYHFADAPRLALDDFEGSLKLVEEQSDGHAGRGLARVRLGDWRSSVADAEAAVRLAGSVDEGQAAFNAARIYAQAMEAAAVEVGRGGEPIVALYRGYRARAMELLDRALRRVSDPSRRREILGDPALRPLRPPPRT